MSDIMTPADRDERGRYKTGNIGGGRPKGARSRLSEAFLQDMHCVWEESGIQALRTCATERPSEFCRIVALLMPRDLNLNIGLDAVAFADRFAQAAQLLGHDLDALHRPRKPLPNQKVIEHGR